jgi:hypothetical protein
MATAKTMVARRAFVRLDGIHYTLVAEGERYAATHPVVKAHPEQFEPETTDVKRPTRRSKP